MLFQAEALQRIVAFLESETVPYMVIGGIANAVWGRARATEDADLKVLTGDRTISDLRKLAETEFEPYHRPWLGPAESPLIISVVVEPGMVADLLVGVFPYEEQAVRRAVKVEFEGIQFRVCTAEDLIIHKAIADRVKDWMDIEGIIWRQKDRLDTKYIGKVLREWGHELEKPHLLAQFEKLLKD